MANITENMKLEFWQQNCTRALERVAELLKERDKLRATIEALKNNQS